MSQISVRKSPFKKKYIFLSPSLIPWKLKVFRILLKLSSFAQGWTFLSSKLTAFPKTVNQFDNGHAKSVDSWAHTQRVLRIILKKIIFLNPFLSKIHTFILFGTIFAVRLIGVKKCLELHRIKVGLPIIPWMKLTIS